ncbi:hypothetical protein [Kamptonema sp. PCC 6506]|uniref:hypothetical protein n=1 Tax=Kamptonema sp. PCC 6506 TaxID=272129 RepID=UPI00030B4D86|nr:hypothetical protein [Kamptonema sp. PCC 6506]
MQPTPQILSVQLRRTGVSSVEPHGNEVLRSVSQPNESYPKLLSCPGILMGGLWLRSIRDTVAEIRVRWGSWRFTRKEELFWHISQQVAAILEQQGVSETDFD